MKKLLLTTALVGVAFTAAPAMAEVSLGLGGHFKGYVTWNDQDTNSLTAPNTDIRTVDMVRDTEIHFTGETTLDNGLTVGFHAEQKLNGGATTIEESYAYFAGNWGRVNFGAEDGAAYLLQVAAPSADSNIDGLRQYISTMNYTADAVRPQYVSNAAGIAGRTAGLIGNLDYDHVASGYNDKLTYITPVFSGFQAGVSYTPDASGYAIANGVDVDDQVDGLGDAWELAARYEGQFNAVRLALGAGYSVTDVERVATLTTAPALAAGNRTDDIQTWNVGGNVGYGPFNFGAAYLKSDNGDISSGALLTSNKDSDTTTWVLGADYTTGPFVIGVSYLDQEQEHGTVDLDSKRYSGGVTYTYGPGMSFRGSVHHVQHEVNVAGVPDVEGTSLLLGTQIGF